MKLLTKISLMLLLLFGVFLDTTYAANAPIPVLDNKNLNIWTASESGTHTNELLDWIQNKTTDYSIGIWWEKWIYFSLIRIARDLKNLFFLIAWIYFLILVLKLLFSWKTEEEISNFKKWILWISVWIIITQLSYYFVNVLFDKEIGNTLATNFIKIIIQPMIWILETATSFIFLAMMVYAFFRLVTSNWDEEKAKNWKMTVMYAAIWFVVVKISWALVNTIYWKTECFSTICQSRQTVVDLEWFAAIVVKIIDWVNGFVGIVVILMIIYAWFSVLVSAWDEEKLKKAKASIMYITIWLLILVTNYLILTFFILPETTI